MVVKTSDSWESTKGGSWTFYNNEPSVSNPSPLMMVSAVNQMFSIISQRIKKYGWK